MDALSAGVRQLPYQVVMVARILSLAMAYSHSGYDIAANRKAETARLPKQLALSCSKMHPRESSTLAHSEIESQAQKVTHSSPSIPAWNSLSAWSTLALICSSEGRWLLMSSTWTLPYVATPIGVLMPLNAHWTSV